MVENIDKVFQHDINEKFSFNKEVVSVFDNMLERSIPYYWDNIYLISSFISLRDVYSICDIGCSTGNLLLHISNTCSSKRLLGIDNSLDMLNVAKSKASAYGANIEFIKADILDFRFNFDCVIANYTIQFIRPFHRESLIKNIFNALNKGGIFIMTEKLSVDNPRLDMNLISIYHSFKKEKGYSNTEIAKKREALENILIPYTQDENIALLKQAGFSVVEVIFKWVNFATFVAIKDV